MPGAGGAAGGFGNLFAAAGSNSLGKAGTGNFGGNKGGGKAGVGKFLGKLFSALGDAKGGGADKKKKGRPGEVEFIKVTPVATVSLALEQRFPNSESILAHSRNNVALGQGITIGGQQVSSTLSTSVEDERLNDGRVTLIPTVWDGRVLPRGESVQRALDSGRKWPAFDDIDTADRVSKLLSQIMGQQAPEQEVQ